MQEKTSKREKTKGYWGNIQSWVMSDDFGYENWKEKDEMQRSKQNLLTKIYIQASIESVTDLKDEEAVSIVLDDIDPEWS